MFEIRRAEQRGHASRGWLDTWHTFSFADYHDPQQMGFGPLRVINDDRVAPGTGFDTHGHRDMEILTYVLAGALEHRDSMGNGAVIGAGEVQRMTAGTGVEHSERNPSATDPVHLLQIWIRPAQTGLAPSYEQRLFGAAEKRGRLRLVASPDGARDSVTIHQDARVYAGLFDAAETATLSLPPGRIAYIHVALGALRVNGHQLSAGDGVRVAETRELVFNDGQGADVLVFDLPAAVASEKGVKS